MSARTHIGGLWPRKSSSSWNQASSSLPDAPSRKLILDELGLPHTFSRAFDLVHIKGRPRPPAPVPLAVNKADLVLIELKTTRKLLPRNPSGFFFGATANELDLARRLGER